MKEEFHYEEGKGFQQLYGWGTINANVWLPSLSELVGHDPNKYNATNGCYNSAMQGLNTATWGCVDSRGGNQFAYFKQYNQSGGGQRIWEASNQQRTWLRSCTVDTSQHAWRSTDAQRFDYSAATLFHAVHPAA